MSRFFPGAQARIVSAGSPFGQQFVGRAVRTLRHEFHPNAGHGWVVDIPIDCGELFFREFELEPIQPLGATPSELSFTELMDRCRAGEVECV